MNRRLKVAAAACIVAGTLGSGNARASGIPVVDIANLIQTILQVLNDVTEISNQVQQITQLQDQLNSINGMRNLGNILNNPMLKNYVPAEAYTYLNAVNTSGYSGLNGTAKALRDVGMVYNCMDLAGAARTSCQAALAQPQSKPAALLHIIESQIDPRLLHDIQRELHLLDETLDFALEFEGARTQLVEMAQQKQGLSMLDALKEKPLSALTNEEREMLKNLTAKKT